jgi:hypothetical protein
MERLHLTYEQAANEPIEVINRAFIIWQMDNQAAELKRPKNS